MPQPGQSGPADLERDATALVTRAGQRQPLRQRHRLAVDLQMRTRVTIEERCNELRAVGTTIIPEVGLRRRCRGTKDRCKNCADDNGIPAISNILPPRGRL